jgi:tetratricopeptide (TPR) repeat protein
MRGLSSLLAVFLLAAAPPAPSPSKAELLWHHRNLGKAFYENPTTQYQAVEELKAALDLAPDSARERVNYALALLKAGKAEEGIAELQKVQKQDPSVPYTWFNLGIAYKRASEYDKAIAQFETMVELVPDEAASHYNLGTLYKLAGKADLSLQHFETAARLSPGLAAPHFQLYNAYKTAGKTDEAQRELKDFQEIKKRNEGAAVPEDLEWSWYVELWDEPAVVANPAPAPAITPVSPKWEVRPLATGIDPATAVLTVLDADGDGKPDLLVTSAAGAALFLGGTTRVEASGLEGLKGITGVAAGDFDNDGLPDLCVVAGGTATLWHNLKGKFEKVSVAMPAGHFTKAVWLDFDHDYDQDLVLLGDSAALLRNAGAAGSVTWSDETKRFPFVAGKAVDAVLFHAVSDTQGFDLAVTYAGRPGVIYRDRLGGTYEAETVEALPAGALPLLAIDANGDGWNDLLAGNALLINQKKQRASAWKVEKASVAPPFVLADLDNRGTASLTSLPASVLAAADVDGDGRIDLAAVGADGALKVYRNVTETPNHWLAVSLQGVKNLKLAPAAEVEVKAGPVYRKQLYQGIPLVFGLGGQSEADTIRITWPNGLIQNETKQPAGRLLAFKEAPRLSGSCPMIFTWNGERFQFITDVLGVAPLGASSGDGDYFPVDHDEYIQIPGGALVPVNGTYEVRITEELREVSYLDQVHLLAVDHPESVEIFTNDKFKSPPFPEFRLFGVERKVRPVAAVEDGGRDVLDRVLTRDQRYPDGFRRNAAGVAELHHLDLDFGSGAAPGNRAVLILSGWVDWADGSTFLSAAQGSPGGLVMPRLQVKDATGRWVTVIEDMGIPSGKPKTISVDLTGKFLSASREVRIETSLCVYWDEIFLSEDTGEPPVALTEWAPSSAELRFRGFSRPVIDPERKQPEGFDYQTFMPVSEWNPTPGLYTRYGDVRELLGDVDDRLVVMGSGDEVRLRFDAEALPRLPAGWRRDFLLKVDGWAKDADANTAFSQSVEPLPFHAMSRYPYPSGERFPDDEAHKTYRAHYNTRPALRLIRPLLQEGRP